jgi:Tfp pilus assembly protein PilP
MDAYTNKLIRTACALSIITLFWGCGDSSEPPPKPKVVTQKIVSGKEAAKPIPKPQKTSEKAKTPKKVKPKDGKVQAPPPIKAKPEMKSPQANGSREMAQKEEKTSEQPAQQKKETAKAPGPKSPVPKKDGQETPVEPAADTEKPGKDSPTGKVDVLTAEEINEVLKLKARKGAAGTSPAGPLTPAAKTKPHRIRLLGAKTPYNPEGKIDPFRPPFKSKEVTHGRRKKRKKRMPLTPLEKVDLGQLKLSAIIRAPSGNRAMVEEATGKGYVITKGTFIGINSGIVTKILNNKVVIEEEYETALDEVKIRKRELRLNKPLGE